MFISMSPADVLQTIYGHPELQQTIEILPAVWRYFLQALGEPPAPRRLMRKALICWFESSPLMLLNRMNCTIESMSYRCYMTKCAFALIAECNG